MTFDEIGHIWRDEVTGDFRRKRTESFFAVRDRAARFDAHARRSRRFFTFVAVFCVPYFTFFAIQEITQGYLVASLGLLIVAASSVILAIRAHRLRGAAPDPTLPVSAAVEAQVTRLRALEWFKGSLEWYLVPLVIGVLISAAGLSVNMSGDPVSLTRRVQVSVVAIAVSVFVFFNNRRDVRLKVRPLREDMESWLTGLRESDLDGV